MTDRHVHCRSTLDAEPSSPDARHCFYNPLDEQLTLVQGGSNPARYGALALGCFAGVGAIPVPEQHRLCVGADIDLDQLGWQGISKYIEVLLKLATGLWLGFFHLGTVPVWASVAACLSPHSCWVGTARVRSQDL